MSVVHVKFPAILADAALRTLLVFGVIALLVGYFFQIGSLTTGGYKIKDLEKQKMIVADENERLKAQIASYQSMGSVKKRLESMGMVKSEKIKYVKLEDSFAKR